MKLKTEDLNFSVNRPQEWWDEKPQYKAMREYLKEQLLAKGQSAPIIVKEAPGGKWDVVKGNQELQAIIDLGWLFVECVHLDKVSKRMLKQDDALDPDIMFKHLIQPPKQEKIAAEELATRREAFEEWKSLQAKRLTR